METVKIVFDVDSKDIKSTTDELKALNKVTNEEVAAMDRLATAAEDAGDGFVSLRSQVRQAKEEAQKAADKYGEFSKEANAARIKAGALADQMGDLNRQVNLLNPEAKAKAFSNLAQGVVGAFAVATGALQAFGVKNKEVEQLAMKLQGALNITQGIASIGQLKESFTDLKIILGFTTSATGTLTAAQKAQALAAAQSTLGTTTLTAAQEAEAIAAAEAAAANQALNATFLTNPIFLVIAALGAFAGSLIILGNQYDDTKNKQIDFTDENEKLKKALDAAKDSADGVSRAMIDLKVAKGEMTAADAAIAKNNMDLAKSTEDVNKSISSSKATIDAYRKSLIDAKKQYDKDIQEAEKDARLSGSVNADRILVQDKRIAKERYDNFVKDTKARIKKEQEILIANQSNLTNLTQTTEAKNTAVTVEESNKRTDAKEEEAKKNNAIAEKEAKELLNRQIQLRNQLQENALAEISDPVERIKQARQFANENYAIEEQRLIDSKATEEERDILAANHTALLKKLGIEEVNANKTKNDKILSAEQKLQEALTNLALAQETDPLKRAQIINDAKEKEIDDKLALVEKGSKEEQALLLEKQTAEIDAAKRIGAAQIEVNKTTNDAITEEDKKAAEDRKALQEAALQSAQFIGDTLFESSTNQTNAELALLEEQKNKKLISEKDYQQKVRQLRQKQAEDQKKQAIFNATVDLARAIIAALTIAPPASAVAANFAAILGGANLAKIIATPIPKFQKGTLAVPGVDMGRDSVHAMLQPGEAVIPVSTNRAYHPTIKAIYEKKISPSEINNFVMSRTSSGGKQSVTANVDTYALSRALGKNKGVQIENANVVGRAMARELLRGQNYRRA